MSATTTVKPSPTPRPRVPEPEKPRLLRRVLRRKVLAAAVLVCLVAGGAVAAGLQISRLTEQADARSSALDAGKRYATTISTYDFRDAAANLNGVVQHSTDKFANEYRNSSGQLMQLITQYQATSQGTVLDAAVTEASADRAVVLAFVDQTITNTNLKDPRIDRSRMKLTMLRADGEWRLDEITLM
ncbi:hypothetical protein [Amycolatopsis albispora]|uniref:Mce-associated membrane protein n=1 Tax=Amycolatopsis albispora TaxID=1804986 RepID=A0A344L522_9PSEU|nr:hypothetical protein [Amycolatopsis albispora]AXB43146.1 hypothetical protein A4R43_11775 [Amycolatopsis albispora]